MVAAPAASHENSCSATVRPRPPRVSRSTPGPSAPLIAAARAEASPAGTSHPFRPVTTLSGSPPALVATTARRWAMASSVTSELPSYNVGCTNSRAVSYHACSVRSSTRPVRSGRGVRPASAIARVPDHHPAPAFASEHRRMIAERAERLGEHVEALVLLQPPHAQDDHLVFIHA